ncbi:16S rRNA (adenine(1518)-N(6)/adenine(1519)-N(6))-dimethyltransferase RsmA [Corynebacterium massiliense]|uniref:16S rRNA (adenine(1518)-N(6)/adenine(1519)-N(6))- dimethyltransferase RsmA n=1 Tax=Corynebacterium massiliense TaxID=441501 RepID=UPI00235737ED|nr:16S rRNA (adenine(1518)-N(6)/adenine(1519)-N(6))-dimethyltransferase RsmA [Corynebacterium massiliense]
MPYSLLGPADIRELAAELDVTPTKKWGQNFLHDANTVRRIVAAADIDASDHVVEVGPGLGSLTLGLMEAAGAVTAVEIDPRLAERLPRTVEQRATDADGAARLTVVHKDALQVGPDDIPSESAGHAPADQAPANQPPTALVANLPYNVAVPVILHLLRTFPTIRRVLVMVQLEVAERLVAQPGTKIYGVPSVKAAFYGSARQAGKIGKHVFWPEPNIESGLVRIDRFPEGDAPWPVTEEERAKVWPIIDAAFAQRRKTLRAALSGHYGSGAAAEEALRAAGIDPRQRGEKIGVADFVRLANVDVVNDASTHGEDAE